jgi:Domain of unknown function (DUF1830)
MLNSSPVASSQFILCYYINVTSQVQVAKISNVANWYFERVVFPGQRLLFEAPVEALMEIYTCTNEPAVLSQIFCEHLQVDIAIAC